MKRFSLSLLLATTIACRGFHQSSGGAPLSTATPIPPSYFGLTLMNSANKPLVPFSTVRTWDSWPRVPWAYVNPAKGIFKFWTLDTFLTQNAGRDIIYTLGRTPQWASSKPDFHTDYGPGQCAPPSDLADWDTYVKTVAVRAAGKIKYWELWNEPMSPKYYCGDIPTMVTMAQHARSIIQSVDPSAMILAPSTDKPFGEAWIKSFLSLGGAATIDIMTVHGYPDNSPEGIVPMLTRYHTLMTANGVGALPIWDTEQDGGPHSTADLAKMYLLEWSSGVSRSIWYAYDDKGGKPLWDSVAGLTPTGTTYSEVYKWMVGASLIAPCAVDGSGVWTCDLKRGTYQARATWSSAGIASNSIAVPPLYREYRDLLGAVHRIDHHKVPVGYEPVLLESGPLPASPGEKPNVPPM